MSEENSDAQRLRSTLERVITLLEDLFILEGCRAGMKQDDIRAILRINKLRVVRVAKHVKEQK